MSYLDHTTLSRVATVPHWEQHTAVIAENEEVCMRTYSNHKTLLTTLLLLGFAVGCCNPSSNPNAGNPAAPQTLPTVILVTPPNANVGIVAIISVTFSKAMKPATINSPAATFTLSGPGGALVIGDVTYIAATNIATFTPSSSLAPSTPYTATITTGAADTYGNTLAADFVWAFTTSSLCTTPTVGTIPVVPPTPPVTAPANPLGAACTFGALAYSTVTNVNNVGTSITGTGTGLGDIGVSPGTAITRFPPGTFTGTENAGNAYAAAGEADLTTAYNNFTGTAGGQVLPANIGGATLPAGVWETTSAQPSLGITGNLTLSGSATDVWIFQIVSTLTTAAAVTPGVPASEVILSGGALPQNVYWVVGSSATLGTYSIFQGSILAKASVSVDTGATLDGRALALNGAVTLDTNKIVVPPCQ
jgi:hypothetical protein